MSTKTQENLTLKIESVRQEMLEAGMKLGLNHPNTIDLSHKLDQLLNKYQGLK
ncbi:aspartyl-phosphate phosphatase Spo0E family protein [Piscibacillus halophilus]|uniref:Spo0E like sporulation regulatory protein n=1 Tax=Piscibacillus halophilus TaxID=571933 RepID=A0A1H9MMQ5_9BACI|nr:aspartyl-phosphate phosphatase Spo0E family protein [Piscibacillus halophilus]SER24994.1 Spo0E like sporulation regulatory protein [Piscibacillus halophilus]